MRKRQSAARPASLRASLVASSLATALVAACGGGDDGTTQVDTAVPNAAVAASTTVLDVQAALPDDVATNVATPTFHLAPVLLGEPDDTDTVDNMTSARLQPRRTAVPGLVVSAGMQRPTARTVEGLQRGTTVANDGSLAPDAASSTVVTYTPAQVRSAYSLPALPAAGATPSATQAAQLGAGQTIYIVDAYHDPNSAAELAAFNQKFGLPSCATVAIPATTKLPLAAASSGGCQYSVAYANASGALASSAPAYDSGWATEIALDVQWAHATAPMARIVLIEVPDASLNSLLGGVNLANAMGSGVVSMSFGGSEGSWTSSVDAAFTGTNMSYLASTGDSGAGVQWPAVSPHVLAVGGTSLNVAGNGTRSESAWSGSGGGLSAYTARPSYQVSSVPGMGSASYRDVADVSFNANPYTGQYLAVMSTSGALSWLSAGGTSLAAPQWAGLIAVANALRAQSGKAPLGAPHAVIYGQVASVAGTYAADIADITTGSDGSCATCVAKVGYDTPTGLGTPNATALLASLAGAGAATPPVVTATTITGTAGIPLSFTANVSAPDPVSYSLAGAPNGMTISAAGIVTWVAPVAGTYTIQLSATDTKTGLKGTGTYTVAIAAPVPPTVASAAINGLAGTPLSYGVAITASNPITLSLSGGASGMSISATGVFTWPSPVVGTTKVTVVAKDTKTGLSGQGTLTIGISANPPPVVASKTVTGTAGTPISFTVSATAVNPVTFSMAGAPAGMSMTTAGAASWANPVAGTYSVNVTAHDAKTGLAGSALITVQVAASGLSITAPPMTGVAGKALADSITIKDGPMSWLQVSIGGAPLGMTFSMSGLTINAAWANPATGNYTLQIAVVDSAGRSQTASVPITVTAH